MKSCADYYERISAYIDNELDEEDRLVVEQHVETCPHCRRLLRAYSEISRAAADTMEDPPEQIRRRIMAEIVKPEGEKPKVRKILFLSPRAATAALIPLVAGFLLIMTLMFRPDGAVQTAMPESAASTARTMMADTNDVVTGYGGNMTPSFEEEEYAWEMDSLFPMDMPSSTTTPPQSPEVGAPTEPRGAADNSFGANQYSAGMMPFDEDDDARFYAIVFIDGEIPPALAGIEPYVTDCGNLFIIIPREMVAELIGQPDVSVEIRNEAADYAKVMF